MNSRPSISVVMPAYKVAPYIGEALESVFAQTFTNYEVIVVNDGSPDTEEFERALEPFMDRIIYMRQENRGVSAARNHALRSARGEFVAFLDADDVWLPSYLQDQLAVIEQHGCDLVCADALHFGGSPFDGRTYMEVLMADAPHSGDVTFLGLLSGEHNLITSGVLARREPILEVGLFDEALRDSEDFDLWLRLARHGVRMVYHRALLLRYRSHKDSLSGDDFNIAVRALRAFDRLEILFELLPDELSEVTSVIRNRRALFEFELGKLYLTRGEFKQARESFRKADALHPSFKLKAACLLLRVSPELLRSLYLRRAIGSSREFTNHAV